METTITDEARIAALAAFLGEDAGEITLSYDGETFEADGEGYLVLTDEEADQKAEEYISESVWAFNVDFIMSHANLPWEAEEMISAFQDAKCEGANDTLKALIKDWDHFVSDAIMADGRAHFLNTYDGRENEATVDGQAFYIYRVS